MNIPSLVTSFLMRARRRARADPSRDWLALLTLSAIVLAGIVVWNIWAFETVADGGAIGGAPAKPTPSIILNHASLDVVRAIFESRAAEKAKYSTGTYRYADPSQ